MNMADEAAICTWMCICRSVPLPFLPWFWIYLADAVNVLQVSHHVRGPGFFFLCVKIKDCSCQKWVLDSVLSVLFIAEPGFSFINVITVVVFNM
jgi:hypothetical protein